MEINTQNQVTQQQQQALNASAKTAEKTPLPADADSSLAAKSSYTQEAVAVTKIEKPEAIRLEARPVEETYVVSDSTFSLFKDSTGQLITRIRSLRDGSVTYIPEPNIMQMTRGAGSSLDTLVEVTA